MSEIDKLTAATLAMMDIIERTEEYGDCLLWTGAVGDSGHPIFKPYGRPCTLVRREVFRLAGGDLVPRQPVDTTCGEKCCLNQAHLFQSTTSEVAKRAAKRGAFSSLVRCKKIADARRKTGKLNIEQA